MFRVLNKDVKPGGSSPTWGLEIVPHTPLLGGYLRKIWWYEASLHVRDVLLAELLDGQRLAVFLAFFSRIAAMGDLSEQGLGFAARGLECPDAMKADRVATRSNTRPVLDDVAALARGIDAKTEAGYASSQTTCPSLCGSTATTNRLVSLAMLPSLGSPDFE